MFVRNNCSANKCANRSKVAMLRYLDLGRQNKLADFNSKLTFSVITEAHCVSRILRIPRETRCTDGKRHNGLARATFWSTLVFLFKQIESQNPVHIRKKTILFVTIDSRLLSGFALKQFRNV